MNYKIVPPDLLAVSIIYQFCGFAPTIVNIASLKIFYLISEGILLAFFFCICEILILADIIRKIH